MLKKIIRTRKGSDFNGVLFKPRAYKGYVYSCLFNKVHEFGSFDFYVEDNKIYMHFNDKGTFKLNKKSRAFTWRPILNEFPKASKFDFLGKWIAVEDDRMPNLFRITKE